MSGRTQIEFQAGPRAHVTLLDGYPRRFSENSSWPLSDHRTVPPVEPRVTAESMPRGVPAVRWTDDRGASWPHRPGERYRHLAAYPTRPQRSPSTVGAPLLRLLRNSVTDTFRSFPAISPGGAPKALLFLSRTRRRHSRNEPSTHRAYAGNGHPNATRRAGQPGRAVAARRWAAGAPAQTMAPGVQGTPQTTREVTGHLGMTRFT